MDQETARYILTYFSRLMTKDESLALKYHLYTYSAPEGSRMRELIIQRGLISTDPEIQDQLRNGYAAFERCVAERIMKTSADQVFLNLCPACSGLARTPRALQCRHCGHSWRDAPGQIAE